jgi:hypothetical protein
VASTPKQLLGHLLGFWSASRSHRLPKEIVDHVLSFDQGLGAFASPLVCQTLIRGGVPWPHFYSGSLLVAAMNSLFLTLAFRSTQREFDHDRQAALDLLSSLAGRDGYAVESKSDLSSPICDEFPSTTAVDAPPPKKCMPLVVTVVFFR